MADLKQKYEDELFLPEHIQAPEQSPTVSRRPRSRRLLYSCGVVYFLIHLLWAESLVNYLHGKWLDYTTESLDALCPQTEGLVPVKNQQTAEDLHSLFATENFQTKAIEWLSGAVQIPTESYDRMDPVGQDSRWLAFGPLHDYLAEGFPLIYSTLKLTKVNTYGLIYEWTGSDSSLKPLLLTAHQDVVPVDPLTVDKWVQPPYSGYFDGEYIWGRGSSDDKSGLIGLMVTVESLIANGFKPSRTIVLAFGFDEESGGIYGAQTLSHELLRVYGEYAFSMIVDEGNGISEKYGALFAVPAVAEKGYINTKIEVKSPGGHSSIPPEHTSIGILASLLVQYEINPFKPVIGRTTATYGTIQCYGAHGDLPKKLKRAVKRSTKSDRAMREVEEFFFQAKEIKAQVGSTQAIDLITGGVKANALPETANAVVNHRIASDSSVAAVQERDTYLVKSLASHYNLSLTAFGQDIIGSEGPYYGSITLSDAYGTAFEPAPVTPTDPEAQAYKLLSGTIISTYKASEEYSENHKPIYVAPGMSTGNTDTRYYWKLSKNIFRYNHKSGNTKWPGVHTINEAVKATSYFEVVKFFTNLILNADESNQI